MGCTHSKVGQVPPDNGISIRDSKAAEASTANDAGGGSAAAAEQSRPALPVVRSTLQLEAKGKAAGTRQHGRCTKQAKKMEEVEGETITDESGLQMRTPRSSSDRGLHFAAKRGDVSLVQHLLGNSGGNALQASDGNVAEGQNFTFSKDTAPNTPSADINERGMWGNTPLLVATQYAHARVALELIQAGADTFAENERRATALHYSCAEGLVDVCQALLLKNTEVDPPTAAIHHPEINGGQTSYLTPLLAAAAGGHSELVRLLITHGADVERRVLPQGPHVEETRDGHSCADGKGMSALMGAAQYGHTETCLLLIDNGARVLAEVRRIVHTHDL